MPLKKRVRVKPGIWRFISMRKVGNRYLWNKRAVYYLVGLGLNTLYYPNVLESCLR